MNNKYFKGAAFQKGFGLGGCFGGVRNQKGSGLGKISSVGVQSGHGLGGMWGKFVDWVSPFISRLKDYAMPLIKSGSKVVGKEVINAAADIANSVLDGKELKESATNRISTSIDNLIGKQMPQAGEGINKNKRRIYGSFSKTKNKKARILDIFDH